MSSKQELLISPSEEKALFSRHYKLLKLLGEGSYAKVYLSEFRATDVDENVLMLACKMIDTSRAPKDFVTKFLPRELEVLLKIDHPHIVHVHSVFQRKFKYFIFMRHAEKGDLLTYIIEHGAIAENQARVWIRQIALALQYLHRLEIAHRDIKCENMLITNNFNVKLADFGFARHIIDSRGKNILSETYCGSVSYAAPEILSATPYQPKIADIWSLGIVLYIMLNDAMPFDDVDVRKLRERQKARRWRFRSKYVKILSDHVKRVVVGLLEPDIVKRWPIDKVLMSDWMAMDSRLIGMTHAESTALEKATEGRKKYLDKLSVKITKIEKKRMTKHTSTENETPEVRKSVDESTNTDKDDWNVLKESDMERRSLTRINENKTDSKSSSKNKSELSDTVSKETSKHTGIHSDKSEMKASIKSEKMAGTTPTTPVNDTSISTINS